MRGFFVLSADLIPTPSPCLRRRVSLRKIHFDYSLETIVFPLSFISRIPLANGRGLDEVKKSPSISRRTFYHKQSFLL